MNTIRHYPVPDREPELYSANHPAPGRDVLPSMDLYEPEPEPEPLGWRVCHLLAAVGLSVGVIGAVVTGCMEGFGK